MRIKRFIASDMRTALRMVRDEQGPDAVILSNRPCEEGVEVVSATDYDEALVHQALRAAAPGIASAPQAEASVPQAAVQPAPAASATGLESPSLNTARARLASVSRTGGGATAATGAGTGAGWTAACGTLASACGADAMPGAAARSAWCTSASS